MSLERRQFWLVLMLGHLQAVLRLYATPSVSREGWLNMQTAPWTCWSGEPFCLPARVAYLVLLALLVPILSAIFLCLRADKERWLLALLAPVVLGYGYFLSLDLRAWGMGTPLLLGLSLLAPRGLAAARVFLLVFTLGSLPGLAWMGDPAFLLLLIPFLGVLFRRPLDWRGGAPGLLVGLLALAANLGPVPGTVQCEYRYRDQRVLLSDVRSAFFQTNQRNLHDPALYEAYARRLRQSLGIPVVDMHLQIGERTWKTAP